MILNRLQTQNNFNNLKNKLVKTCQGPYGGITNLRTTSTKEHLPWGLRPIMGLVGKPPPIVRMILFRDLPCNSIPAGISLEKQTKIIKNPLLQLHYSLNCFPLEVAKLSWFHCRCLSIIIYNLPVSHRFLGKMFY